MSLLCALSLSCAWRILTYSKPDYPGERLNQVSGSALLIEKYLLYNGVMGKLHSGEGWIIVVRGNEHPPVHAHVLHSDGKAVVYLSGKMLNSGVPAKVLRAARAWIGAHAEDVRCEWAKMNNPRRR